MALDDATLAAVSHTYNFTGALKVALEGRCRLRVPAGMRKDLPDHERVKVGRTFIQDLALPDDEPGGTYDPDNPGIRCVAIYPLAAFQRIMNRLERQQRDPELARAARVMMNQGFEETTVGAGSRIDVGSWVNDLGLIEEESVKKEAELWVVGDGNRILLMHLKDYARRQAYYEQPMVEAELSRLIEDLM